MIWGYHYPWKHPYKIIEIWNGWLALVVGPRYFWHMCFGILGWIGFLNFQRLGFSQRIYRLKNSPPTNQENIIPQKRPGPKKKSTLPNSKSQLFQGWTAAAFAGAKADRSWKFTWIGDFWLCTIWHASKYMKKNKTNPKNTATLVASGWNITTRI